MAEARRAREDEEANLRASWSALAGAILLQGCPATRQYNKTQQNTTETSHTRIPLPGYQDIASQSECTFVITHIDTCRKREHFIGTEAYLSIEKADVNEPMDAKNT
ncbi:hypothetical protein KSD_66170 [Ktedonobacter sp. SOSP1-85]|nr:hypothetical protein KSD_66170 [Ktedonobacter sp. SOSP1-85]